MCTWGGAIEEEEDDDEAGAAAMAGAGPGGCAQVRMRMQIQQLEAQVLRIQEQHEGRNRAVEAAATKAWQDWARAAFDGGAGRAHRFTQLKAEVEVAPSRGTCQPTELADAELQQWTAIWTHHGLGAASLPPGSESWPELDPITVDQLRKTLFAFPVNSAVGQTGLHPRQLQHLSDQAMLTLSLLFTACEQQLGWPPDRLATILVRLPKPDGGARLIALMSTLARAFRRRQRSVLSSGRSPTTR